jgi:hypothetical protein
MTTHIFNKSYSGLLARERFLVKWNKIFGIIAGVSTMFFVILFFIFLVIVF